MYTLPRTKSTPTIKNKTPIVRLLTALTRISIHYLNSNELNRKDRTSICVIFRYKTCKQLPKAQLPISNDQFPSPE